jgi:alpha-L-rhamnosidase
MVSVPTDCPHRERNGWLGDALDVSEAECLNFDALTFYENWFVNLVEDQEENGHVPCISPFHSKSILKLVDIPWSAAVVLIPWDLYQAYGDRKILADNYQMMKKFIEFMGSVSDHDHIITSGVTWNDHIGSEKPGNEFIGSVYYYRCSKLMVLISRELGEDKDATFYEALSGEIRDGINRRFLVQGKYYEEGTQSANAHALFFEIVPEEYKSAVMESLVNNLIKKGGLTTGCHGTYALVPALAQNGGNDLVYKLATQTTLGAWGYWISECNATTALEHWDGKRTHSYNHPFLIGSLSAWFYRQLGGIRMEAPGYSKIEIKPYIPNDLTHAIANVNTPRGILSSEWKKEDGMLYMNVIIPFNSVATVYIPCMALSEIRESEEMGEAGRPVECIGYEEGYAKLIIGSGEYYFTSRI